jgi:integrase
MGRKPAAREPVSKIYWSNYDHQHHCWVNMHRPRPDGKPDRRHLRNKDRDKLIAAVLELEDLRDAGIVPPKGRRQRAEKWMRFWMGEIAPIRAGYSTMEIRKWAVNLYLIPRLGRHWLDEIATGHIEVMYSDLDQEGLSANSIGLIHETLVMLLNKAKDHAFLRGDNPAVNADRPVVVETEVEPLDGADTIKFLIEASKRRNFLRWVLGFLGNRQGECLGSRWSDLENDEWLNIQAKVQRRKYQHGCGDPKTCAAKHCHTKPCEGPWRHGCDDPRSCAKRHCNRPSYPSDAKRGIRRKPCPPGCTGHERGCPDRYRGPCPKKRHKACPPLCKPGCVGHAKACPQRIGGVLLIEPEQAEVSTEDDKPRRKGARRRTKRRKATVTKTNAGTRRQAIPSVFKPIIATHRLQQEAERAAAGSKWVENGLIICDEFGRPIDRSKDWSEWADILEVAGIEHLPLHGLRHGAASFLLALGVDRRIVMDILGWKDERMLLRYQHVADELRRDAADLLGSILHADSATNSATPDNVVPLFRYKEKAPEPDVYAGPEASSVG